MTLPFSYPVLSVLPSFSLANVLTGGPGDDTLVGSFFGDTMIGGGGLNFLWGSYGSDTYVVSNNTTYIYDTGGTDTVYVNADFVKVPDDSIENIIYGAGYKPLPYWVNGLLPDASNGNRYLALLGDARAYSFAFPTVAAPYATAASGVMRFTPFAEAQKVFTRSALHYVESIVDLHFSETEDAIGPNTLAYSNSTQYDSEGFSFYPNASALGSDVFIQNSGDWATDYASPVDGNYSAYLYMHETGHALGLKHPFEGVQRLDPQEDNPVDTVMSYDPTAASEHMKYADLDIAALQYLYGPSKTARLGDSIYRYNEATSNFIWDGGGNDTIDASGSSKSVTIYLKPGYWGFNGPSAAAHITGPGQITVNFGTPIENLIGSQHNDRLFGNDLNNTIRGGGGNDIIDGGKGIDTVLFGSAHSDYAITGLNTNSRVADNRDGAPDGLDTLVNVERLAFTDTRIALDVSGNAGDVAKLMGAIFGADSVRVQHGIAGAGLFYRDGGMSYSDLGALALSAIGANTNAQVVETLWLHVAGSAGSAGNFAPYIAMLDRGMSRGDLAVMAANMALNTDRIDLVGLMHSGLEFYA